MSIPVGWFIQILNMSLGAAWAALLVMAGRLLLQKAPKKIPYALWGVVLFRLVCPVSFTSIFSLMPRPQTIPQDILYAPQPEIESGFVVFDQAVNQSLPPAAPAANASANPVQFWLEIGSLVWQVGALLLLLYCVLSYLRFSRRLGEATLREGNIWESDRIPTAFVLGFFRPRIYLPLGLEEEEREYILCHEETHIRRMDHLIKPLALLLLCVHWFNPVLWLAYFLMCRDMEMSCDELVMEKLGSGIRKGYSTSLLAVSARQSGLVTPLAFGENDVKNRIQNVLRYKKPAFWVLMAALVLGVILAFCLLANPREQWIPLLEQEDLPYHGGSWAEKIQVERQGSGRVLLEDPEQVRQLRELVTGLEVGKKPVPSKERNAVWELRLTFLGDGDNSATLCFTSDTVWGKDERVYPLRESAHLYRMVEDFTFLTDPSQAGEYRVSFLEVLDGREQQYLISTEPLVGSRLASLLLDGTLLEEKPGQTPPTGSYLFINMGNPGTGYYLYELDGRFYLERPEDYRLELAEAIYREIVEVYQTVSRQEIPGETKGVYTGFEETAAGKRLRKFTGYQGETATKLAELILGGADVPLNPLEKVVPTDSFLRVEIREPGNAYYIYEDQGHYYAERLMNYRVELTEDAYQQIRNLYLDTAEEGVLQEALSFYAEGEMADIARVGVEGYFGAFTAEDIPEELRILRFTLGEIVPMAGTLEEFAVSFLWDYDTTGESRWLSANGNGQPAADFDGWHWTENYQEFRFRRVQGKLYEVAGLGTGGGGQGLAPIQTAGGPSRRAQMALEQLLSWTVQQVEEGDAAVDRARAAVPLPSGGTGIDEYGSDLLDYYADRLGDVMSGDCIQRMVADRTLNRVISLARSAGADIGANGIALERRAAGAEVYDFLATIQTVAGETVATAQGNLTMEQEGTVWKATRIALTVGASTSGGGQTTTPTGSGTDPLARFRLENYLDREPGSDTAPADALCAYLIQHLTQEQYSAIGRVRDSATGRYPVVRVAAADTAPVEALLAGYTGTPAPVEYQATPFSAAQLKEARSAVNTFMKEHTNSGYYLLTTLYDGVLVQIPEENQALRAFIAAYPVEDIFRLEVSPQVLNRNPDTDPAPFPTSPETERRRNALVDELYDALPMDAYNHFELWCEGESIILEIAVTDEAAVDQVLNRWSGTKWNQMQKIDGRCSRARLAAFAQAVNQLDFGPGASAENAHEGYGRVGISVSYDTEEATEEANWRGMPEAVSRLMTEMGIPADLVDYGVMGYRPPSGPGMTVNPDT